jgi:hypothetical protein
MKLADPRSPQKAALTAVTWLLSAVPPGRRSPTLALLTDPRRGGRGLRKWLTLLDTDDHPPPTALPGELIDVYLTDEEAEPLHDCERCGLAVPVRAGRRCGHEAVVEHVYFPTCPCCGGRTGRHAYWSRRIDN